MIGYSFFFFTGSDPNDNEKFHYLHLIGDRDRVGFTAHVKSSCLFLVQPYTSFRTEINVGSRQNLKTPACIKLAMSGHLTLSSVVVVLFCLL